MRLLVCEQSPGAIARALGRSKSTTCRELGRNGNADGAHKPDTAERRDLARRHEGCLLDRLAGLRAFVAGRLHETWTPKQIAGWLKPDAECLRAVCQETIYVWIYDRSQRQAKLWRLLPRKKGKFGFRPARTPRVAIKDRNSIQDRLEAVDDRAEVSHWEADLLNLKWTRPVPVLCERQ